MKGKVFMKIMSRVGPKNISSFVSKISRRTSSGFKAAQYKRLNRSFEPQDALVIFSEARGGSTWVMELITDSMNAINIFEPLWGREGEFSRFANKFSSPFFFGKKEDDTEDILFNFTQQTLAGKETSPRTLQFNDLKSLKEANQLVVKMVNVNLIAPWFFDKFPLNKKPLYVIRHPLAILASRLKYAQNYNQEFRNVPMPKYSLEKLKSEDHPYVPHLEMLNKYNLKYPRYLVEWCIRNHEFLKGKYSDQCTSVYYEELFIEPDRVRKELEDSLGMELSFSALRKASGTTALNSEVLEKNQQLNKWMKMFTDEQLSEFQEIFDAFDITQYSARNGEYKPNLKAS